MRIIGLKSVRIGARWLRSRFARNALILGYHRVADDDHDPFNITVSPEHFAGHMDVLKRHAHPADLSSVIRGLRERRLNDRMVALTFDDGYSDTLYTVKPLLEHFDAPATVFISTGYIGQRFWWDRLKTAIFTLDGLHPRLQLRIDNDLFQWLDGTPGRNTDRSRRPDARKHLLMSLYDRLRRLPTEERERAIKELEKWGETGEPAFGSGPRALTAAEIVELASGGRIQVGSHSTTHPWLQELSPSRQDLEIRESKARLEDILKLPVSFFSYPNGSTASVTPLLVQRAGYEGACTSCSDVVTSKSDIYRLPRFLIPDWSAERFESWLLKWLPAHGA